VSGESSKEYQQSDSSFEDMVSKLNAEIKNKNRIINQLQAEEGWKVAAGFRPSNMESKQMIQLLLQFKAELQSSKEVYTSKSSK
jgi:glycine cleavage system H lipoate-binding protein